MLIMVIMRDTLVDVAVMLVEAVIFLALTCTLSFKPDYSHAIGPGPGRSPNQESIGPGTKRSSVSSGVRSRNQKDFFYKFVESERLRISFHQLTRIPNVFYASSSDTVEATTYLVVEDFLHASIKGLWEAFWSQDEPLPFSVACMYNSNLEFYQAEKSIANGRLGGLCGTGILLNYPKHPHGKWDNVLELALLRPDIRGLAVGNDQQPSPSILGEALFCAIRMLLARSLSRLSFFPDSSTVFVLIVDSQYGGVVKVEGDVNKLNFDVNNIYECVVEWVKIMLELMFHQLIGYGKKLEMQTGETLVLFRYQQQSVSPEIVEVQEDSVEVELKELMRLELEPAWEDVSLWYQVQRQTKVLTIMKHKCLSSKYMPQLSASGRIIHPGECRRPSKGGNCEHPWCGTPILMTSPVGETVAEMVQSGQFGEGEAIRCCHDCLSVLSTVASAGIRHGDIRPENVICVTSGRKLCSASDAESLVYMLYYSCGGVLPNLDSVEGALQWRETSWSRRLIQQKLGDISATLKAFADYVDSLCGTPYPMDYEIWLRRWRQNIHEEDHGKEIVAAG
ncbi:unnamed protein product [Lupinus luteus]|uniref:Uncharacterized protein n=1 Tax=Lupinus luteus TaxID=3873 RepID=A0AAV1XM85_LUPLU